MNDFTKKELIALEDAMQNMLNIHTPQDGKSPLLNKIQSMIDNFCEHEFYLIGCGENISAQCHKCGEIGKFQRTVLL